MIRILDRMVLSIFTKLFLAFVLGAPFLFVVADATENVDKYLGRQLTIFEVALGYAYLLPKFMLWSFPIAALVAAVFTVHGMTTHREVVAAKAGGVSFHRLVVPLVGMGVILTGAGLVLTELVPRTNRRAMEALKEIQSRREWRTNFVYQTEDGYMLTAQRLSVADGSLSSVALERERLDGEGLESHTVAESARFDPAQGWVFYNGYTRHFTGGDEQAYAFEAYRTRWFTEEPVDLLEEPRDDDEMTYQELGKMADMVRRSGGDPTELLVAKEEKLAIPVATLVIILFGLPLATTVKRGGASYGIGISLASTILYLVLMRVSTAIGESGGLPPLAAAWLPNALFLAAGLVLLTRVRT